MWGGIRPGMPAFEEAWLAGYDGTQFYTRTYPADSPRAVLLFVHGFSEHIGRYEWAHGASASKGVTVFAFDQRGFGRTALDTAHKSKKSAFGKTNLHDQLSDIEWWVRRLNREHPELPLFIMGHSMGAALCLAFVTRTGTPPSQDSVSLVSGVIPSSTLLLQMVSTSKPVRYIAEKLSIILPNLLFNAALPNDCLSRDPAVIAALEADPLVIQKGSLRGLSDMLNVGEQLWKYDYQNWPRSLPIIFMHGSADKVTSFQAAREFYENIKADDKQFKIFEGAYHELVNEPEGVKEQYMEDCISWILGHARRRDEHAPPAESPAS
ncbi:lysophospholipase [Trametes meyenii]|nr:lysophospholipase [Trametes meyenii]